MKEQYWFLMKKVLLLPWCLGLMDAAAGVSERSKKANVGSIREGEYGCYNIRDGTHLAGEGSLN